MGQTRHEADGLAHSKPGSVDQQSEDSFPSSDAPSFSPGAVGAPRGRSKAAHIGHEPSPKAKTGEGTKSTT